MRHESWNLTGEKAPASRDREAALGGLADEFDAWADAGRGERMEKGHWPTARQALDRIAWGDVSAFLDMGCGNGYAVRHAAAHMQPDGVAYGLDLSPRMIDTATAATGAWRKSLDAPVADSRFLVAPFDGIPLEDESLDIVFTNEALYYAPDVQAALTEVLRVLRPGGRFVCGIDFFEENVHSHDWQEKVGVPMLMDSEAGWCSRLTDAGFVSVGAERLLDPSGVPPLDADADDAARRDHETLRAWKEEVGTLLLVGQKAT